MPEQFRYEDEFLELRSELRFLSYAIEQSLLGMKSQGEPEDVDNISYGFSLCARRVLHRLETLETEVIRRLL